MRLQAGRRVGELRSEAARLLEPAQLAQVGLVRVRLRVRLRV